MDGTRVPCRLDVVLSDGPDARGFRGDIGPYEGITPWPKAINDKGPLIRWSWTQVVYYSCPAQRMWGTSICTRSLHAHESGEESGID